MSVPSLPSDDQDRASREDALETRRDTYRFVHDWPLDVATSSWLPEEVNYSKVYTARLVPIYASIGANFAAVIAKQDERGLLERLKDDFEKVKDDFETDTVGKEIFTRFHKHAERAVFHDKPETWKDYDEVFETWETPDIVAPVNDDATLGDAIAWQRMAGVNPMVLARTTAIPDDFPVTEEHVSQALPGDSLEAALAEGRAFLADHRALEGVACGVIEGQQKYLAGPIALYIADRQGTLRSVAVQCGTDPSRFPVRTPADGWHWRMANQCVQVADANHHEGSAHLGRTHLVMESVGLAMKRELAPNHPLAALLEPHLETTFAINHSAKTSLIAPGGTVSQVFAPKIRAFGDFVHSQVSTYSIRDAHPAIDLAKRGLDDTDVLPTHPYRDDILPVHAAIQGHVSRYLRLYYSSDEVLRADPELAGFVRALGARDGGRLHDVPAVNTVDDLVGLITSFVWIATAQHSAMNFPQYRFMGYMPNMAGALFGPVPDASTANTEEAFLDLLPPSKVTHNGVSMVYLLSHLRATKLGHYSPRDFADPRVLPLVARFARDLEQIESDTSARDAGRWLPYPYLLPSNILQSISI